MITESDNYVKILIRFHSDIFDEDIVETMWAEIIDKNNGLYKIDNIPFYAPLASDDIVFAEYDDIEEMLTFRRTVECSGNSTIQVVIFEKTKDTNSVRKIFEDLGCSTEKLQEGYFVIEVLSTMNYQPIKMILNELSDSNVIDYAEPCLAEDHKKQALKLSI